MTVESVKHGEYSVALERSSYRGIPHVHRLEAKLSAADNCIARISAILVDGEADVEEVMQDDEIMMFPDELDELLASGHSTIIISTIDVEVAHRGAGLGMNLSSVVEESSGASYALLVCMPILDDSPQDTKSILRLVSYYARSGYRIVGKTYSGYPIMRKLLAS